jgi:uncharacterized protein (DUF362 family)
MPNRSVVAVVRAAPDRVLEDLGGLCEKAGMKQALDSAATTLLKENISWHYPLPGANTTPWQLDGTIRALRSAGFQDLVCVANDTVVTNSLKGERNNRLRRVYERHKVRVLYTFQKEDVEWVAFQPKSELLALHRIFPEGIKIPALFVGKNIVHLPTVKTHIYTTTTGAMKNAFGGLLNRRRHYAHSAIHETLVDLLAIQKEIHRGIFCVMDGTTCGSGPGPRTMKPVRKDLLLASSDSVAIDAVAAKIMGFDPMSIPYIRMAHERGLGTGRIEELNLVGEDISAMNFGFSVGDNMASRIGDLLWFGALKRLQHMLFRTPLVYAFILGSFLYHDFFWWPVYGRRIFQRFAREDPWGQLFDSYPR